MSEKKRLLIKGADIINEGKRAKGSILIEGTKIVAILADGAELPQADEVINAEGLLCIPGVIDDQVHFREPGLRHKGDLRSESEAAILGGVTSFMDMPNTLPQTTTLEAWRDKMARANEVACANYAFYFGATNDNATLLEEIDVEHTPGVKVFMGSSTGQMLVDSEEALAKIFFRSPILIAVHSEDERIIQANRAKYTELYGEDPEVKWHPYIRSREACVACTERAIRLAHKYQARLHILHLSTADEVALLTPDASTPLSKKLITGEVCVHHLWFSDEDYERLGTRIKWNPAIKSSEDRKALRKAIEERRVDIVATDHAPHLWEEKVGGALKAASGGPLVQHSLLMMMELAKRGNWNLATVVEYMCHRPATLFNIKERGYIREGYFADLVLIKPESPWEVSKSNIRSKCGWSPIEGELLSNKVWYTLLNGVLVVREGILHADEATKAKQALLFSHPKREIDQRKYL